MDKRPRFSLSRHPIENPSKLYLPASLAIVPPFQVIFNRETVNTSYSEPTDMEAKRQGKIVNTFDLTNIDDFFSHPSADELAAASERRVNDIMTDLNLLTTSELESWSHGSYTEKISKPGSHDSAGCTSETDMVSFPIPLPSKPLPNCLRTSSNCPAAFTSDSKIDNPKERPFTIHDRAATSSLQSKLLRATTRELKSNRTVVEKHNHTDQTKTLPTLSTDRHGTEFLSPKAIDTRITTHQYANLTFETQTDLYLPCQKPLPPTPGALLRAMKQAEEHPHARAISETDLDNTQTTRDPQAHCSTAPSISMTPPLQDRLTPIHAPVKRKALPLDSPLLVQLNRHSASIE